jgi:hypothetical protein
MAFYLRSSGSPVEVKSGNSTLTACRGDHLSPTIAINRKSTGDCARNYTTCGDTNQNMGPKSNREPSKRVSLQARWPDGQSTKGSSGTQRNDCYASLTIFIFYARSPGSKAPKKGNLMPAEIDIYNPKELGPPLGRYAHVTRVKANEFLFIAGMVSGDTAGNCNGDPAGKSPRGCLYTGEVCLG